MSRYNKKQPFQFQQDDKQYLGEYSDRSVLPLQENTDIYPNREIDSGKCSYKKRHRLSPYNSLSAYKENLPRTPMKRKKDVQPETINMLSNTRSNPEETTEVIAPASGPVCQQQNVAMNQTQLNGDDIVPEIAANNCFPDVHSFPEQLDIDNSLNGFDQYKHPPDPFIDINDPLIEDIDGEQRAVNDEENLYKGCKLSQHDFAILFTIFVTKFCLSDSAKKGLLDFLIVLLPQDNIVPSLYQIEKMTPSLSKEPTLYTLCSACHTQLEKSVCPNQECSKSSVPFKDQMTYYVFNVESSLRKIVQENLDLVATYHQKRSNKLVDIVDGEIYQSKRSGDNIVTLVWHIDGAPTVKSRNLPIWLISAFIVELGMNRYKMKNIVLCGVWYGPSKPNFDLFQISFTRQIKRLMTNGFQIEGKSKTFFLNIQAQMADLPAKAASLKMKQFNGLNGCSVCYHPGENYRCWVYPYKGDQRDRKYAEVWRDAHLAEVNGAEENGVKGKSVVLDIQRIPEEAPFDYMHLVLEGEWKRKLLLLLDPRNGYITKGELEQLDQSVKAIKFPHDFKERVTEVSLESIRKAKASEQQLLILHVLFPLLKGVLDEELFVHLGLLVTANHILNQDSASDQDVKNADTMLKTYHRLNEDLYNKSEMTYTNHALTHLAKQRKAHGCPLVLLSNFVFEGFIATLKRQYHGSTGVVSQMVRNVVVLQDLERYAEAFRGGALFEYVKEILYGKQLKMNKLEDNTKVQGIVDTLEHDVPDDISSFCNTNGAQYWQRMEVNSRMFHSLAYKRKGQSASYLAIINSNGKKLFGKILVFLSVHSFGFAMVQLFEKTQNRLFDNAYADENVAELVRENILGCGFIPLKLTKDIVLVRGAELSKRFLFVTNNEKTDFASEELYSYQHD